MYAVNFSGIIALIMYPLAIAKVTEEIETNKQEEL